MTYRILFAGMGSIGRRHIRNVSDYLKSRNDTVEIDLIRSGYGAALESDLESMIRRVYAYDDEVADCYDIMFITNPSSLHYETLRKYAAKAHNFFIEKPVFDRTDYDLSKLHFRSDAVCYVACPLRYNRVLQYINKNLPCEAAYSVRSICSSYLPEWRPQTDYRQTYSARRDMGGGAALDLIHEWDYLTWLFGKPDAVSSMICKRSSLEVDCDDIAVYIARNQHTVFELHLDYFGRQSIRQMQIFLPEETLEADIARGTLRYLRQGRVVRLPEARNAYQQREIAHFFDIIEGRCGNDNDIRNAAAILSIAVGGAS